MIQKLIKHDRYVVGAHAAERLEERHFLEWQLIADMPDAILIEERPDTKPNPSVKVEIVLPDGQPAIAIWSILKKSGVAKLVTVYYSDR